MRSVTLLRGSGGRSGRAESGVRLALRRCALRGPRYNSFATKGALPALRTTNERRYLPGTLLTNPTLVTTVVTSLVFLQ